MISKAPQARYAAAESWTCQGAVYSGLAKHEYTARMLPSVNADPRGLKSMS
jgi:hypothetical protein